MLGKFILTLGVFARCENFSSDDTCVLQTQRKSRYDPPEGLGPGGNPVSRLPNPTQDVSIDDEVIACADPKWQPNAQNIWTFEQIGEAFMEFGYKKFYKPGSVDPVSTCVAALTIVSGECQETLQSTGIGCDAKSTGDSGVFQLDYLLSPKTPLREKILPQVEKEGNMMNLCISGFGAGYLTGAPYATNPLNKAVASLVQTSLYTCMDSPADVNDYSCPDPHAKKGVIYSNFIGTFCHKSYLQRWAPCNIHSTEDRCCGLFNGGANNDGALDQPPFPEYYYKKADVHLQKMPKGKNFKTICEKIVEKMEAPSLEEVAEAASRQICEGTIESGDTCYIVKQWWNVPYSAIKNKETGEVCPKPLGWVGQKLEITNPPGGCGGLWPNPPPPVPCAEYDGQFTFAVDKWTDWQYKAGPGRIGICFGGASSLVLNELCENGGVQWKLMNKMTQGDKYYDFGGGDAVENQWITPENLGGPTGLDSIMGTRLKTANYQGIFYDIETFKQDFNKEDVLKALKASFAKAKSHGFKVIASTSYLAPYHAYEDRGYMTKSDYVWKGVMADKNVDVFMPQFYGNGRTADIKASWGSSIDFSDWTKTIRASAKIIPILKAESETYFKNQVQQMKNKCSQIGTIWCDSGFFLWGSRDDQHR